MMTQVDIILPSTEDDGIDHYFCCRTDGSIGLCGTSLDGSDEDEEIDVNCIVCLDLAELPCPYGFECLDD